MSNFTKVYFSKYSRIFFLSKGWTSLISTVVITGIVILVVGSGAFDSYSAAKSAAFALICCCIWIGLFNSIQTICAERQTIQHEIRSGVPYSAFLVGHLAVDFLLCLAQALIVVGILILRYSSSLAADDQLSATLVVGLFVVFFLTIYAADSLGLMISSVVRTQQQAMTIMPFVLIVQLVMSGFLFKLQGIAEFLSYATLAKWGLQGALMVWNVNDMPLVPETSAAATEQARMLEQTYIQQSLNDNFQTYEPTLTNLIMVPVVFVVFFVVHTVLAYFGIKNIEKDSR